MKKLFIILLCGGLFVSVQALAQQTPQIVETETHSVFKGLFLRVWEKLKNINPAQKQSAKSVQVFTAGIRGAEATDTLLKPYWKDDLSQDEKFQAELQQFSKAQLKLDQGDLKNAVSEFESFLSDFRTSSLRPNALFAHSIGQAGLGDKQKSLISMQLFIDENPNHPLIEDARQILGELSS